MIQINVHNVNHLMEYRIVLVLFYVSYVKLIIVFNVPYHRLLLVQHVIKHMGYLQLIQILVKNVKYLIVNNALNLQLNVYDALMGIQ